MQAQIEINGKQVMVDDYSLGKLNAVLALVPIMEQKQIESEWKYIQVPGKHLRLIPEFAIRNAYYTDPK